MPVAIDHVESEVVVEGGRGSGGGGGREDGRNLPEPQAVRRWLAHERQVRWDRERTSAVDYDHGE